MLDTYLAEVDKRGLPSEPYGKMRFQGYEERVVPRTLRKEQDAKLRELAEKAGRSLSELVREAVESFDEDKTTARNESMGTWADKRPLEFTWYNINVRSSQRSIPGVEHV